jgi:hypothetical protein
MGNFIWVETERASSDNGGGSFCPAMDSKAKGVPTALQTSLLMVLVMIGAVLVPMVPMGPVPIIIVSVPPNTMALGIIIILGHAGNVGPSRDQENQPSQQKPFPPLLPKHNASLRFYSLLPNKRLEITI